MNDSATRQRRPNGSLVDQVTALLRHWGDLTQAELGILMGGLHRTTVAATLSRMNRKWPNIPKRVL